MEKDLWKKAVQVCLRADVPVLIWGDPGIGKTSFMYNLAKEIDWPIEVLIASIREPSDFLGLPILQQDGESVALAAPLWAKKMKEKVSNGCPAGIVMFDEISTTPPAVQAALLRVIFEKVVGDCKLPQGVRMVAVANPADQVGGWELMLPLTNRFCHIEAQSPTVEAWAEGMVSGWRENIVPISEGAREEAAALIGGFLRHRPEFHTQKPKDTAKDKRAWPSPRSWALAVKVLQYAPSNDKTLKNMLLAGCVGQGPAIEFVEWQQNLDLPLPQDVLKKGAKFKFNKDRHDKAFVILDGVVRYTVEKLTEKPTEKLWIAAWDVLGAACDCGMPDVAAASIKNLARNYPDRYPIPDSVEKLGPILNIHKE